jgi:hypothetical protein
MARRRLAVVGVLLVLGTIVLVASLFRTHDGNAYPAPARVPAVLGLTKDEALRRIEGAHLKPVVHYTRVRNVRHGRVVAVGMSHLLSVPGRVFPRISLEGTPIALEVAR